MAQPFRKEVWTDGYLTDHILNFLNTASDLNPADFPSFIMAPATTGVQNIAAAAEPEHGHGQNLAIRNGNTGRHLKHGWQKEMWTRGAQHSLPENIPKRGGRQVEKTSPAACCFNPDRCRMAARGSQSLRRKRHRIIFSARLRAHARQYTGARG